MQTRSDLYIDATDLEPYSTHDLYIESFNTLSEDLATLRTDHVEILIEPKACDILQENLDAFVAEHAQEYDLYAQLGIGWEQKSYFNLFETAYFEFFGLDDPDRESCGELTTEFVSPYPFLNDFPTLKTLVLQPDWTDPEGTFTEAYQVFSVNGFSASIPVKATVWDCDLISVAFR